LHAALALVAWAWTACFLVFRYRQIPASGRKQLIWSGTTGFAICLLVFFLTLSFRVAPPFAPPYDGSLGAETVYESFTRLDVHRQIAWLPLGYVLNPLVFMVLGFLLLLSPPVAGRRGELQGEQRSAGQWTMVLGVVAWGVVLAGLLGRWVLGELPRPAELMMPLRFSNFTVVLLVPLAVALVCKAIEGMEPAAARTAELSLALAVGTAGVLRLLEGGSIGALYPGRVLGMFLYAFFGMALAAYLDFRRRERTRLAAGLAVAVLVLAGLLFSLRSPNGAMMFAAALAGTWLLLAVVRAILAKASLGQRAASGTANAVLAAACVLAALAFLPGREVDPWNRAVQRWDVIRPFDIELKAWLRQNAGPAEMVLGPIYPRPEIQPKTGYPVLMELETLYLMSYMPSLSSTIGTMAHDLYGVDFTDADQVSRIEREPGPLAESQEWLRSWHERSRDQWQAVGRKYGFRLVLAPASPPLDLPVALTGSEYSLYVIP
jgi:hypothetical protein